MIQLSRSHVLIPVARYADSHYPLLLFRYSYTYTTNLYLKPLKRIIRLSLTPSPTIARISRDNSSYSATTEK